MKTSFVKYILMLIGILAGCHLGPIESNNEEQNINMSALDMSIIQDLRSDMNDAMKPSPDPHSCEFSGNERKGFCATNSWIKCQNDSWCHFQRYPDYLSIKSDKSVNKPCSCSVSWNRNDMNDEVYLCYYYQISNDTATIDYITEYNSAKYSTPIKGSGPMRFSYTGCREIDDLGGNNLTLSVNFTFCNSTECDVEPEFRLYDMRVKVKNGNTIIYEVPKRN